MLLKQEGEESVLWGPFLQRAEPVGDVAPGQSHAISSAPCLFLPSSLSMLFASACLGSQGSLILWKKPQTQLSEQDWTLLCHTELQGIC